MRPRDDARPLALLWTLAWKDRTDDRLTCGVYRADDGLHLRLESPTATILNERFDLEPRMLARSKALRTSLKRRGWEDVPE